MGQKYPMHKKTALVTGCSAGGLGAALAIAFRDNDYRVLATVRTLDKAGTLATEPDIELLTLDVTSEDSIAACVARVRSATAGRLDVLANNAGVALFGPLLHASVAQGRAAYDVNVWGPLAVAQACAPMLIETRGVILNISSIAGAVPLAWQGLYNSSKAALTFISETLKMELAPLGVRVVTAMVGAVGTTLYEGNEAVLPADSPYASIEGTIRAQSRGDLQAPFNEPVDVTARNLVRDTLAGRRGQIWRGGEAGRASVLSWLVPTVLRERILHAQRGLYDLKYEG